MAPVTGRAGEAVGRPHGARQPALFRPRRRGRPRRRRHSGLRCTATPPSTSLRHPDPVPARCRPITPTTAPIPAPWWSTSPTRTPTATTTRSPSPSAQCRPGRVGFGHLAHSQTAQVESSSNVIDPLDLPIRVERTGVGTYTVDPPNLKDQSGFMISATRRTPASSVVAVSAERASSCLATLEPSRSAPTTNSTASPPT